MNHCWLLWCGCVWASMVWQQADVALLQLDDVARLEPLHAFAPLLKAAIWGVGASATRDNSSCVRHANVEARVSISLAELLHALCAAVRRDEAALMSRLRFECPALTDAFLTAFDAWLKAPTEREVERAFLFARSRLRDALAEFLDTNRYACRARARVLQAMSWSALERLLVGRRCEQLQAPPGNRSDEPFLALFFGGGDNQCPFSRRMAPAVRRVLRLFPTVHFFELRAPSAWTAYWTTHSSFMSLLAVASPPEDEMARCLKHLTSTPALLLLQCSTNGRARLVASARRSSVSVDSLSRWLALTTGLPAQLEFDGARGDDEPPIDVDEQWFTTRLPSEEATFVLAVALIVVQTLRKMR